MCTPSASASSPGSFAPGSYDHCFTPSLAPCPSAVCSRDDPVPYTLAFAPAHRGFTPCIASFQLCTARCQNMHPLCAMLYTAGALRHALQREGERERERERVDCDGERGAGVSGVKTCIRFAPCLAPRCTRRDLHIALHHVVYTALCTM